MTPAQRESSLGEDARSTRRILRDVISWLVINSMRVDGIQFNLLCEQNVSNIWRKRAFGYITTHHLAMDSTSCPATATRALQIFRERVDFNVENMVPTTSKYSEKIRNLINTHRYEPFFTSIVVYPC
jgi:hypothetical protein